MSGRRMTPCVRSPQLGLRLDRGQGCKPVHLGPASSRGPRAHPSWLLADPGRSACDQVPEQVPAQERILSLDFVGWPARGRLCLLHRTRHHRRSRERAGPYLPTRTILAALFRVSLGMGRPYRHRLYAPELFPPLGDDRSCCGPAARPLTSGSGNCLKVAE